MSQQRRDLSSAFFNRLPAWARPRTRAHCAPARRLGRATDDEDLPHELISGRGRQRQSIGNPSYCKGGGSVGGVGLPCVSFLSLQLNRRRLAGRGLERRPNHSAGGSQADSRHPGRMCGSYFLPASTQSHLSFFGVLRGCYALG
jgi:hypothetical protein